MTRRVYLAQKQNGLNFQYDPLEAPEGSYLKADNVWANREGLLESRRGMNVYEGEEAITEALFEYSDRVQQLLDDGTLRYDSNGTGTMASHSGTFDPPSATVRMRNQESRKQNFITTSLGVYSQDSLTDAPKRAGIEPFLELTISTSGDGDPAGPVQTGAVTGYRCVFGRENANGRILRGAPSEQTRVFSKLYSGTFAQAGTTVSVVTDEEHDLTTDDTIRVVSCDRASYVGGYYAVTAVSPDPPGPSDDLTFTGDDATDSGNITLGVDRNAAIEFPIPDDVVAGDFYEIYRTDPSASDTTLPGEEHYLVTQEVVTASDISTGTISYTDSIPAALLDKNTPLYTNPSLGSSSRPNDRPPYCVDLAEFRGHMHFAAAQWEQERKITMKDDTGLVAGTSYLKFGTETYTFETAESVGNKEFKLFTTGDTDAENIRDTMLSLVRIVNRASSLFYAFYVSGSEGAPGQVLIRHRLLNQSAFDLTANSSTTGGLFEPEIPTAGSTLYSEAPGAINVLARSKFEQPEAVPRLSTSPVGTEVQRIERILSLRDVMVILKDEDGLHVQTGETDGTVGAKFRIKERDRSLDILGRDTACVVQNRVYCYSNQGFVEISEAGATIVGREVEEEAERIHATASWDTLAFAFGYESEDMYVCFGPEASGDTECELAWTYNVHNKSWTNGWRRTCTAGMVLRSDDKYYLANQRGSDTWILQERKSLAFTRADYMDEWFSVVFQSKSTTTNEDGDTVSVINVLASSSDYAPTPGCILAQGSLAVMIDKVTETGTNEYDCRLVLQTDSFVSAATIFTLPIYVEIETVDFAGKNAAALKQFSHVQLEFENDRAQNHFIAFRSDIVPTYSYPDLPLNNEPPDPSWYYNTLDTGTTGDSDDVTATPLVVPVPTDYAKARRLRIRYKHCYAGEKVSLSQITVPFREISLRGSKKVYR